MSIYIYIVYIWHASWKTSWSLGLLREEWRHVSFLEGFTRCNKTWILHEVCVAIATFHLGKQVTLHDLTIDRWWYFRGKLQRNLHLFDRQIIQQSGISLHQSRDRVYRTIMTMICMSHLGPGPGCSRILYLSPCTGFNYNRSTVDAGTSQYIFKRCCGRHSKYAMEEICISFQHYKQLLEEGTSFYKKLGLGILGSKGSLLELVCSSTPNFCGWAIFPIKVTYIYITLDGSTFMQTTDARILRCFTWILQVHDEEFKQPAPRVRG